MPLVGTKEMLQYACKSWHYFIDNKILKHLLLVLIILFVPFKVLNARNFEDVVYLKNGGIIRGIIVEQTANGAIKIKINNQNLFVYNAEEVEKAVKEYRFQKMGYINYSDIGVNIAVDKKQQIITELSINTVHGYLFNPHISCGLGFGFDLCQKKEYDLYGMMFPIYTDIRWIFFKNQISPYTFASVGYSIGLLHGYSEANYGGPMIHLGLGGKLNLAKRTSLLINVGYKYQKAITMEYVYHDNDMTQLFLERIGHSNNFLSISTGLSL